MAFSPVEMFLEVAQAVNKEFTIGVAEEAIHQITGCEVELGHECVRCSEDCERVEEEKDDWVWEE